jgi:two-component system sensor histidine kinase QseC
MRSLRDRLTRLLLAVLIPIWLVMAFTSYVSVLHEVDEIDARQLDEVAQPYLRMSVPGLQKALELAVSRDQDDDEPPLSVLRWGSQGDLLYRSPMAPALSFASRPSHEGEDASEPDSLNLLQLQGTSWRVLWHYDHVHGEWTAVLCAMTERDELARGMALGLILPSLVMALALVLVVSWAVRRGLRPLKEVERQVSQRQDQDMSPIETGDVPREVTPLLNEINALLARLDRALSLERQFTADASHELRTPLAAAMAQIEVAQGAVDDTQRDTALKQARAGLTRANTLTEQLLALARLDHHLDGRLDRATRAAWPGWQHELDVAELVRQEMADLALMSVKADVALSLDAPEQPCRVGAQPQWLSLAVRNVLGNALKFTPPGGQVRVTVSETANEVCVVVRDTGPGVPDEMLLQLGRRFARGDHTRSGSGLGLSIASRVAELHGGALRFASAQGLTVTLTLPK